MMDRGAWRCEQKKCMKKEMVELLPNQYRHRTIVDLGLLSGVYSLFLHDKY